MERRIWPAGSSVMKRAPPRSRAKISRRKPGGSLTGLSCAAAGAARGARTTPRRGQGMPASDYARGNPGSGAAVEELGRELLEIFHAERLVEDRGAGLLEELLHPRRLGGAGHESDAGDELRAPPRELAVEAWAVQLRHPEIAQ